MERNENSVAGLPDEYTIFRGDGADEEGSNLSDMIFVIDREASISTQDYVRSPCPALGVQEFWIPIITQEIFDDKDLTSSIRPFTLIDPYDREMIES